MRAWVRPNSGLARCRVLCVPAGTRALGLPSLLCALLLSSSQRPAFASLLVRTDWDYVINGKTSIGNEREFHHHGSTLNAVAVLDSYRAYPRRGYLLRLGAAALLGHLSNIHPSGAASMAWHGDPTLLRRDSYSGDYGIGLYGYWRSASSYLECTPSRGWECALCDLLGTHPTSAAGPADSTVCAGRVSFAPRDAFQRRVYIAPLGLTVSLEGARIVLVEFDAASLVLSLSLMKHESAPSVEATLFVRTERVQPPPAVTASALRASCHTPAPSTGAEACVVAGRLGESFVVRLGGGMHEITRVRLEPM